MSAGFAYARPVFHVNKRGGSQIKDSFETQDHERRGQIVSHEKEDADTHSSGCPVLDYI